MSVVLQLEERVVKNHWLLESGPSGQFYTRGGPEMGPHDPNFGLALFARN